MKKTVLLTGGRGFLAVALTTELLDRGYKVIAVDDNSKYGPTSRPFDSHKNYKFKKLNLITDINKFEKLVMKYRPSMILNFAAKIGGISYFHAFAYDLLDNNDRITGNVFNVAIKARQAGFLERIIQASSSMVYESTSEYPTTESTINSNPPPLSSYGNSKLHSEIYAKAAFEQYGLPYTIIRPFNCVGCGEEKSIKEDSMMIGDQKMLMSHVLPDLIYRALKSKADDKCIILGSGEQLRQYTNARDIARGIRLAMESEKATNQDFNISHSKPTSVKELAEAVWVHIHGCKPQFQHEKPFEYDVQKRVSDTSKAKEILGFEAIISLEESIKEVTEYIKNNIEKFN
jgi:UDP-glucose 4-epimerase